MKKLALHFGIIINVLNLSAQSKKTTQVAQNIWDSIKASTYINIEPAFINEYNTPYKQPLAAYGWEDGIQISTDGLNLYCLYSPMDLVSSTIFVLNNLNSPFCNLFGNMSFIKPYAQFYGMDMVTNNFGCDSFANIDILYSHRSSVIDSFATWQLSGIARPGFIEGGPSTLLSQTNTNQLDLFFYTGNGDIWMMKNTSTNPSGINTSTRLPSPINPVTNEFNADNVFVERISGNNIIIIYEKYTNPDNRTFMFSLSSDLGITWGQPQAINTINNSIGHIEHPCLYKDNNNIWWLYYSIDYEYIVRSQQLVPGNWDSWGTPQKIISKGNAVAIGEPTITNSGDISFAVGYKNTLTNDSTDLYDLDPWIMTKKTLLNVKNSTNSNNAFQLDIFPNPTADKLNVSCNNNTTKNIQIYNSLGIIVLEFELISTTQIDLQHLQSGLYFLGLKNSNGPLKKIIKQ